MRDADAEFIELMGRHFEEEGVPRIAGRLFGLLMLGEADLSLDELAERLQVSKGSVSSNARLLEEWGVAERITRPGDRRDYYRISTGISERLIERQITRMRLLIDRLSHSREKLAPLPEGADQRFSAAIRFNQLAISSLLTLREQLVGAGDAGSC